MTTDPADVRAAIDRHREAEFDRVEFLAARPSPFVEAIEPILA